MSVKAARVEEMPPMGVKILSARALDDLNGLLGHAKRHLATDGVAFFPKGARWKQEHEEARKHWNYDLDIIKSNTNPDATILKIKEVAHA